MLALFSRLIVYSIAYFYMLNRNNNKIIIKLDQLFEGKKTYSTGVFYVLQFSIFSNGADYPLNSAFKFWINFCQYMYWFPIVFPLFVSVILGNKGKLFYHLIWLYYYTAATNLKHFRTVFWKCNFASKLLVNLIGKGFKNPVTLLFCLNQQSLWLLLLLGWITHF